MYVSTKIAVLKIKVEIKRIMRNQIRPNKRHVRKATIKLIATQKKYNKLNLTRTWNELFTDVMSSMGTRFIYIADGVTYGIM